MMTTASEAKTGVKTPGIPQGFAERSDKGGPQPIDTTKWAGSEKQAMAILLIHGQLLVEATRGERSKCGFKGCKKESEAFFSIPKLKAEGYDPNNIEWFKKKLDRVNETWCFEHAPANFFPHWFADGKHMGDNAYYCETHVKGNECRGKKAIWSYGGNFADGAYFQIFCGNHNPVGPTPADAEVFESAKRDELMPVEEKEEVRELGEVDPQPAAKFFSPTPCCFASPAYEIENASQGHYTVECPVCIRRYRVVIDQSGDYRSIADLSIRFYAKD